VEGLKYILPTADLVLGSYLTSFTLRTETTAVPSYFSLKLDPAAEAVSPTTPPLAVSFAWAAVQLAEPESQT